MEAFSLNFSIQIWHQILLFGNTPWFAPHSLPMLVTPDLWACVCYYSLPFPVYANIPAPRVCISLPGSAPSAILILRAVPWGALANACCCRFKPEVSGLLLQRPARYDLTLYLIYAKPPHYWAVVSNALLSPLHLCVVTLLPLATWPASARSSKCSLPGSLLRLPCSC